MWLELFLCLVLAHFHYGHSVVVFGLSWLVTWDVRFWWCALLIGVSHFGVDMWKSYREECLKWFSVDQILHIAVLVGVAWLWSANYEWYMPLEVKTAYLAMVVAALVCWKPSNIFIKLMLKHYSVKMPEEEASGFNVGALIGTIERWLILIFVCMQRYEALGLLIAAKSIIRYSDKQTTKTEYVLAGTLLSIFIAVIMGLLVCLTY